MCIIFDFNEFCRRNCDKEKWYTCVVLGLTSTKEIVDSESRNFLINRG